MRIHQAICSNWHNLSKQFTRVDVGVWAGRRLNTP